MITLVEASKFACRTLNRLLMPLALLAGVQAAAQVYPAGFQQEPVTTGLTNPTALAFAPDGRIFVCEQAGKVRIVKNGSLLAAPFLQVSVNSNGERGLIGIAIDPDFENNRYVYVYHTVNTAPLHNRIVRVTADGDVAPAGSDTTILVLDNLSSATNHNGGAIGFGADGKLYVAIGDNATGANAQNMNTYHGKFLRINKDGSIPAGNPFSDGSDKKRRFWAFGLRNPYTFAIQPGTARIFVNDVGQVTWEEINDATTGGLNFGWPAEEGIPDNAGSETPVFAYSHGAGDGKGCAITGGTFFNPAATSYPGEYYGKYFFQDYCNGWIGFIDPSVDAPARTPFATGLGNFSLGLITGNDGNLYYLNRPGHALYRITYSLPTPPFITAQPENTASTEGDETVLHVGAVGSLPLQYQWYKNGNAVEGATAASFIIETTEAADAGLYKVTVSNEAGSVGSDEVSVTVMEVNDPPVATIVLPEHNSTYAAGTSLQFSGLATDEEDGELPPEAFGWEITFRSGDQVHDQLSVPAVRSGEFQIADEGVTSDDVFYRMVLTVADAEGVVAKDSVDILPRKSTITFQTEPEGLQLTLDDQTILTPHAVAGVAGMKRRVGVVSPQVAGDTEYYFDSWAHGGAGSQVIVTPEEDATFTAVFSIVLGSEGSPDHRPVVIFPNPVDAPVADARLIIYSSRPQPVSVHAVDVMSRRIGEFEGMLSEGENTVPVDVETLGNGLYALVVEYGGMRKTVRLLISR